MDLISSIAWSILIFISGWIVGWLIYVIYKSIKDEIEINKLIKGIK